jgi:predicted amidohydrolase
MENFKVTVVQTDIVWENPEANILKYNNLFSEIGQTDLILLPETFNTGFTVKTVSMAESMDGITISWIKKVAREKNAAITGSLIVAENGNIFNRLVWAFPDGNLEWYDKRHLFTMGNEHQHFTKGTQRKIMEFRGWRFCPLICYDLRFPVWSRNTDDYDVLIYLANWPASRQFVWEKLLVARAIENQCYCIGVNRVGIDGAGIKSDGNSMLVTPRGVSDMLGGCESLKTFDLSYSNLHDFRKSFPLLQDRDNFEII